MNKRTNGLRLMKPFLPPFEEVLPYLQHIWESRWLTNSGSVHGEFEEALCDYLGVEHISLFTNGTLALTLALKALDLKGEVITTPFTSVSTVQAIYWNGLTPVFADIKGEDFTIDVKKIEKAITSETSCILPVHIFGHPCEIEAINELAGKYSLKVVYDAAHSFGVRYHEKSVCAYGDLSVLSFHATKVFNSIEGGAVICRDRKMKSHLDALANSGLVNEYELAGYGLNAKMNELQAAFGIMNLKYVDRVIEARKASFDLYRQELEGIEGVEMQKLKEGTSRNYSYLPVLIHPEKFGATRDEVMLRMEENQIFPKKYFHPLVSDFHQFKRFITSELPVARRVASQVICLPHYHDISLMDIQSVTGTLKSFKINK